LCKRIIIIGKGKILFDGPIRELNYRILNEKNLIIDLKDEKELIEPANTRIVEKNGHRIRLSYDPKIITTKELIGNIMEQYDIMDISIENPPIEKLIAKLYEDFKI
jgi:ABC-2 type transport system ATP-binding protein